MPGANRHALAQMKQHLDELYRDVGEANRHLQEVRARRQAARADLDVVIQAALKDGDTWREIGEAMGVTAQAAQQMYQRSRG